MRVIGIAAQQQAAGLPVRIMGLKARQVGFSTNVEAVIFSDCQIRSNRRGFVCAHDDDSSTTLFRMTQLMEAELPADERWPKVYSSRREIIFDAPHRSQVQVQTAGKVTLKGAGTLGRSTMFHNLHCSEVAFWRNAKQNLLSVLQCVPDEPDTMIFLESTANGASGEFYERWNAATRRWNAATTDLERLSGYVPVFISWLSCSDYALALPAEGLRAETRGEDLDEKEQGLLARGATLEQLAWRRLAIRDKCGSDEDLFEQEYPSTPAEAFKTSGRPAIPAAIVERHDHTACEPSRWVHLVEQHGEVVAVDAAPGSRNTWQIWHEPDETCDYTLFGDVAEGSLADAADVQSDPDFSAGIVLNRRYLRLDAMYHGRPEADEFGEELRKGGLYYRDAWTTPEANACGIAALVPLKKTAYPNLYQRTRPEESVAAGEDSPMWGWKTTTGNRDFMIDTWIAMCREHPVEGWAPAVKVLQQILADEERAFVRKASGKREHGDGYHDDVLFAAMGAVQLHVLCPRGEFQTSPAVLRQRRPARYVGGVDPGIGVEDEEFVTTG
ncbi:MAG TPA: hypothetical protein VMY35_03060 [Phycisphaerae bacterium]|nr:hypothetical protein [Phycisphaerae bacterium]